MSRKVLFEINTFQLSQCFHCQTGAQPEFVIGGGLTLRLRILYA